MHEQYKIREARFFLERMEESVEDREAFRYYLSGFLSAARSVLQYALEEIKKKGGQKWYDNIVAGNEVLSFFKDKRDVNIHDEPVNPSSHISIAISEPISVFDALATEVYINGKLVEKNKPKGDLPPPKPTESRSEATVRYRFDDWSGPEDVIALSRRYIEELERFVKEGIEQGYLSG